MKAEPNGPAPTQAADHIDDGRKGDSREMNTASKSGSDSKEGMMETQRSVREKTSLRVGGAKRFVVAFRQYGTYLNAPIRWEATIDCGSRIEATSIAQRQARKLDAVYEGTMEWG